jgi:hypothetical protein
MAGCLSILPSLRRKTQPREAPTPIPHMQTCPPVTCCSFEPLPAYSSHQKGRLAEVPIGDEKMEGVMADVASTIEKKIKSLDGELRDLSLKMWNLKEIMWEER